MLGVSNEHRMIPAFFALALEKELEYDCLYVHINSSDDQATSDINLVASQQYLQSSVQSTVYNKRRPALGFVYLCSLGGSTIIFRYCLLGGNTAVPSGLYDRLCHAFLVKHILQGGPEMLQKVYCI